MSQTTVSSLPLFFPVRLRRQRQGSTKWDGQGVLGPCLPCRDPACKRPSCNTRAVPATTPSSDTHLSPGTASPGPAAPPELTDG